MNFIQTYNMGPAGEIVFNVTNYKAKTVRDLVDEILKERPNEWGSISVKGHIWGGYCEYKKGSLTSELSPEVLDMEIREVKSVGGWTRMDYDIYTKNKETMKRTDDGHFIDDPMDVINCKPDFSGMALVKTRLEEVTQFYGQRKGETSYTLITDFRGFMPNIGVAQMFTINGILYRFASMEIIIDTYGGFIFQNVLLKEE